MSYMNQFPSDYHDIPDEILNSGFADSSWGNEMCPSFEKSAGVWAVRIWVDHPDRSRREIDGKRFLVVRYKSDDSSTTEEILATDDVAEAVRVAQLEVEKLS